MTPETEKTRLEFDVKIIRAQTNRSNQVEVTFLLVKAEPELVAWLVAAQMDKAKLRCSLGQMELKHGAIRL